jgi:hypothetical protein
LKYVFSQKYMASTAMQGCSRIAVFFPQPIPLALFLSREMAQEFTTREEMLLLFFVTFLSSSFFRFWAGRGTAAKFAHVGVVGNSRKTGGPIVCMFGQGSAL